MIQRRQSTLLLLLLALYVVVAVVYALMPGGALETAALFEQTTWLAPWQIAVGNGLLIVIVYVPVGLIGLWLSHKAGLPGVFRTGASVHEWLIWPLLVGVGAGIILVIIDWLAQRWSDFPGIPHPPFPASILASFAAGVGEEILFRLFVMSLWTVILGWLLRRFSPMQHARTWSLWIANGFAALAFAASHLGTAMVITGASVPAELPPVLLIELFVLNGLVGILAGVAFARDGLIAAAGVHFWADMVWHVLYGVVS